MLVHRKTDYALRCALVLATPPGRQLSVAALAEAVSVPAPVLAQVLHALQRAGLLASRRGKSGGYRLARLPESIAVLEVIDALQGGIAVNDCAVEGGTCQRAAACPLHPVWCGLRRELRERLARLDLASLTRAPPLPPGA